MSATVGASPLPNPKGIPLLEIDIPVSDQLGFWECVEALIELQR